MLNQRFLHVTLIIAAICACFSTQASEAPIMAPTTNKDSQDAPTDIQMGYEYVTKALTNARKECNTVQSISTMANGSALVDCLSKDHKSVIHYRITPHQADVPRIDLISRTRVASGVASTVDAASEEREKTANKYATAIIQDYRYDCAQVVKVTTQEDDSLIAVCTSDYSRNAISYRLVETPGAHMNARVTPVQ